VQSEAKEGEEGDDDDDDDDDKEEHDDDAKDTKCEDQEEPDAAAKGDGEDANEEDPDDAKDAKQDDEAKNREDDDDDDEDDKEQGEIQEVDAKEEEEEVDAKSGGSEEEKKKKFPATAEAEEDEEELDDEDKEVQNIMKISDDEEKVKESSDSDVEMVEEITKDDDDNDIEEVIDDDEEGAAAAAKAAGKGDKDEQEVVELSDSDSPEPDSLSEEEDDLVGDPNSEPGKDATKFIDAAHLIPFRHGWRREVVQRRVGRGGITSTQCDIYYLPPVNQKYRTREAKRKRRSKADQEKYFDDFPHDDLSIANFNYVRRPLEINNAAYEIVRKARKDDATAVDGSGGGRKKSKSVLIGGQRSRGYKEVEESAGLLSGDSDEADEEEEIAFKEGFDLDLPLTLQVRKCLVGLRAEHKKRRRHRDPETCCTPPMAEDNLWSRIDEDPLGIYNDLGGCSSPATPPPLRAVKMTFNATAVKIGEAHEAVMVEAAKVPMTKEQEMKEELASHDAAIKKFKDFVYRYVVVLKRL
jgi:hypothetical protein